MVGDRLYVPVALKKLPSICVGGSPVGCRRPGLVGTPTEEVAHWRIHETSQYVAERMELVEARMNFTSFKAPDEHDLEGLLEDLKWWCEEGGETER